MQEEEQKIQEKAETSIYFTVDLIESQGLILSVNKIATSSQN